MARSLHNQGDAQKDVLQGFVPGRYIGFLISINIVNDTDLLITSDLFNQDKWQAWLNHCKKVLGPQDTRSHEPGSTPFEQYSDGSHIKPVAYNTRCYQTVFTYEKPTLYSAPNANSKLGPDGNIDPLTQDRALLNKVSFITHNKNHTNV